MSNYVESKKALDKIREDFGCKGDIIFRTAIQYVVGYGQYMFNDQDFVDDQMQQIDDKHNTAEADGKRLFIARDFEKAIIECAEALAKINTYDLLIYIQQEVWLGGSGIDYKRAIDIVQTCLNYIMDSECIGNDEVLNKFYELDLNDEEIENLNFGWVFEEEE